jgi:SAM-dependent methyltransferase
MPDEYSKTIESYDKHAKELAEYFKGIGPRVNYIVQALELAGNPEHARVVEVGCGDGRDTKEIVKRVAWYQGFDPSVGMLDIAKKVLPGTDFVVGDVQNYKFPANLDVVYAFASLLHVPKSDLPKVFEKVHEALKEGGVFFITVKERNFYEQEVKKDQFGERMFYYYTSEVIKKVAGDKFETVFEEHSDHLVPTNKSKWLAMAFRKV